MRVCDGGFDLRGFIDTLYGIGIVGWGFGNGDVGMG